MLDPGPTELDKYRSLNNDSKTFLSLNIFWFSVNLYEAGTPKPREYTEQTDFLGVLTAS